MDNILDKKEQEFLNRMIKGSKKELTNEEYDKIVQTLINLGTTVRNMWVSEKEMSDNIDKLIDVSTRLLEKINVLEQEVEELKSKQQ